jgi:hypothetical protein
MKIVKQGFNDCVLACIAMVLNKELSEIHEVYPEFDDNGVTIDDTIMILNRLGFANYAKHASNRLFDNRTYIVTVPSLTTRGCNHAVVIENLQVYDPNLIDKPEDSYTNDTLKCWSEVLEIIV